MSAYTSVTIALNSSDKLMDGGRGRWTGRAGAEAEAEDEMEKETKSWLADQCIHVLCSRHCYSSLFNSAYSREGVDK